MQQEQDTISRENMPTESSAPVTMRIGDIVRNERFQIRRKLDKGTVSRYASSYNSGCKMPPVTVAKIRLGFVLVDGFHRIAALEKLGIDTVSVDVVETTMEKACLMAAMANITHGLPLKSAEMREVFRAYVRAKGHQCSDKNEWDYQQNKSYRVIARELGGLKDFTTIRLWMQKDFPQIARDYAPETTKRNQGGLPDSDTTDTLGRATAEALDQALAAFRGIGDPACRSRMVSHAEGMLKQMKADTPIGPVVHSDDF